MEPLEYAEDLLFILLSNACSVVCYGDNPLMGILDCRNMHSRRVLPPVFQCVADKVLQQLQQVCPVDRQYRKGIVRHFSVAVLDGGPEIHENLPEHLICVGTGLCRFCTLEAALYRRAGQRSGFAYDQTHQPCV
jgi:hypothetical protein